MERADHHPPARRRRRHLGSIAAIAAFVALLAACSAEEPSAEPSVRDTADGGSSILQATIGDGGTGGQTDTDDTPGSDSDGNDSTSDSDTTDPTDNDGFCQADPPTEIRFERGGTSSTIDVAASADQRDFYTLEVGADQIMTIRVDSADATAAARLRAPTTDQPSTEFTERTIVPTRAGFYEICVAAGPDGADYQLFVSVIDDNTPVRIDAPWCGATVNDRGEIRFDAGAFGTTIEGGVLRDERDLYRIEAGAGQDLDLFLASLEDNAVFDLQAPSGELLIDEVSDFRIPLPEDGDYQICIGSVRGNASYTLDVSIT